VDEKIRGENYNKHNNDGEDEAFGIHGWEIVAKKHRATRSEIHRKIASRVRDELDAATVPRTFAECRPQTLRVKLPESRLEGSA
jgi:hypothetical protein